MKSKKIGSRYFVRIDKGEEVVSSLKSFCAENRITLGSVLGIGAADRVTVGLFNTATKEYHNKALEGEYEITNLTGSVTTKDGEVYLHLHITLADEEYKAYGGHLNECRISGTCELVIDTVEGRMDRFFDDHCGLNIWKID